MLFFIRVSVVLVSLHSNRRLTKTVMLRSLSGFNFIVNPSYYSGVHDYVDCFIRSCLINTHDRNRLFSIRNPYAYFPCLCFSSLMSSKNLAIRNNIELSSYWLEGQVQGRCTVSQKLHSPRKHGVMCVGRVWNHLVLLVFPISTIPKERHLYLLALQYTAQWPPFPIHRGRITFNGYSERKQFAQNPIFRVIKPMFPSCSGVFIIMILETFLNSFKFPCIHY